MSDKKGHDNSTIVSKTNNSINYDFMLSSLSPFNFLFSSKTLFRYMYIWLLANYGLDENPSNATYAIRFKIPSTPEEIRTLPSKLVHGHPMYACKCPVRFGILSTEGGFEVEILPQNNKAKYVLIKYILCVNTDRKLFKLAQIVERVTYKWVLRLKY